MLYSKQFVKKKIVKTLAFLFFRSDIIPNIIEQECENIHITFEMLFSIKIDFFSIK